MKKLLLIGSNSIHTYNYYQLVKDYFEEIHIITSKGRFNFNSPTTLVSFSVKNIVGLLKTVAIVKKVVDRFKPSIIHIHQAGTVAFIANLATRKFDTPKILTAWGSDVLCAETKGNLYQYMLKYNINNVSHITADSEHVSAILQRMSKSLLSITVANFGIDIEQIDYDINKENIIYSNRLHHPLYQIEKIITGFKRFLTTSEEKNWKLIIAGDGTNTSNLKQMVYDLMLTKQVEFVGWLDKNSNIDYYKRAKLFVSIPQSDATSISLLEAMAYNCIPIVSDLPSNKEWISDNKNGVLVNNYSENFIQQALEINNATCLEFNKNLISRMATKSVNKEKFIKVYESIL